MRSPCPSFLLIVLLCTAAAAPASAEGPQPGGSISAYPVCDRKPTREDSEAAHNAFLLGKRKYDEADYPSALVYFKDAYKTDCTKNELILIISTTYERNGDKAEAINAIEVYLKRVPNAPDADVQSKRLANMKAQMAEQQQPASSPANAPSTTSTSASRPPPPPQEAGGHGVAPWIVVASGGAMMITGAVLLVVGAGKVSEVNTACPNKACPTGPGASFTTASAMDQDGQGKTLENIGAVVGGLGVVAVAGGLTWHFLEKPAVTAAEGARAGVNLRPRLMPGYAGAILGGRF